MEVFAEAQKRKNRIAGEIWMNYFNQYLYENHIISERQMRKMHHLILQNARHEKRVDKIESLQNTKKGIGTLFGVPVPFCLSGAYFVFWCVYRPILTHGKYKSQPQILCKDWGQIHSQLEIFFADRLPQ